MLQRRPIDGPNTLKRYGKADDAAVHCRQSHSSHFDRKLDVPLIGCVDPMHNVNLPINKSLAVLFDSMENDNYIVMFADSTAFSAVPLFRVDIYKHLYWDIIACIVFTMCHHKTDSVVHCDMCRCLAYVRSFNWQGIHS